MKIQIHPEYEKFLSGDATQTNWPFPDHELPDRKPIDHYAVDVKNETKFTDKSLHIAKEVAKSLVKIYGPEHVELRPVNLTEEDYRKEDEARRERRWLETVYKPEPVRRPHIRK